jgi:hypothetical protein
MMSQTFTLVAVGSMMISLSVNKWDDFRNRNHKKELIRYYLIIYSLDFSFVHLSMWWNKVTVGNGFLDN